MSIPKISLWVVTPVLAVLGVACAGPEDAASALAGAATVRLVSSSDLYQSLVASSRSASASPFPSFESLYDHMVQDFSDQTISIDGHQRVHPRTTLINNKDVFTMLAGRYGSVDEFLRQSQGAVNEMLGSEARFTASLYATMASIGELALDDSAPPVGPAYSQTNPGNNDCTNWQVGWNSCSAQYAGSIQTYNTTYLNKNVDAQIREWNNFVAQSVTCYQNMIDSWPTAAGQPAQGFSEGGIPLPGCGSSRNTPVNQDPVQASWQPAGGVQIPAGVHAAGH